MSNSNEALSGALRKMDKALGALTVARSMAEPGTEDYTRLSKAEEHLSLAFAQVERCCGGATAKIGEMEHMDMKQMLTLETLETELQKIDVLLDDVQTDFVGRMAVAADRHDVETVYCLAACEANRADIRCSLMAGVLSDAHVHIAEALAGGGDPGLTPEARRGTMAGVGA